MNEERDYLSVLADALSALQEIPDNEHSEEVGETLDAVVEDVSDVLDWLRGA